MEFLGSYCYIVWTDHRRDDNGISATVSPCFAGGYEYGSSTPGIHARARPCCSTRSRPYCAGRANTRCRTIGPWYGHGTAARPRGSEYSPTGSTPTHGP
ncbi:MAG: hypothetical protein DRG82_00105 [Deltaproteobacteria bacterium]|nr:MAG: hypothetical protein DRG82_00105 [Deltaproteobacteria bacterium]